MAQFHWNCLWKYWLFTIMFTVMQLCLFFLPTIDPNHPNKLMNNVDFDKHWRYFENVNYFYLFPSSQESSLSIYRSDLGHDLSDFKFIHKGYHNENKYYSNGKRYIFKHNRSNKNCWAFQPQLNDSFVECDHSLYRNTYIIGDNVLYLKPTKEYRWINTNTKEEIKRYVGPYEIIDIKLGTYGNRLIYTLSNKHNKLLVDIKDLKQFNQSLNKYCDPNELCLESKRYTATVQHGLYLKDEYLKIKSLIILPNVEISKCIDYKTNIPKTLTNNIVDLNNGKSFWIWYNNSGDIDSRGYNNNGKWIYNGTYNDSPYYYNINIPKIIFLFSVKKIFWSWVPKLMNDEYVVKHYCYYDENCWMMGRDKGSDCQRSLSKRRDYCVFCKGPFGYTPISSTKKASHWPTSYQSPNWIQCDQITLKENYQITSKYMFVNNSYGAVYLYCMDDQIINKINKLKYKFDWGQVNRYPQIGDMYDFQSCIMYDFQRWQFNWKYVILYHSNMSETFSISANVGGNELIMNKWKNETNVPFQKGQTVSKLLSWETDLPIDYGRSEVHYKTVSMSCI
eukprot:65832_1